MDCKDCENYRECALERRGICKDFKKKRGDRSGRNERTIKGTLREYC